MERHIVQMFVNRVNQYDDKEVFRVREKDKSFSSISWIQAKAKVDAVYASLYALGCKKGEKIGIFSPNCAQWLITDLGILALGGVVVPFYATASQEQLKYIVNETAMEVMFVGNSEQLEIALSLFGTCDSLRQLILFDNYHGDDPRVTGFDMFLRQGEEHPATIEENIENIFADDLATIIYTSGTTGEPKGVMLAHENFMHCFRIHDDRLNVDENDLSLCFLPLSHVFERLWSHYLLHCGAVNAFLENPREVIEVLPVVKPTLMCTVPRFFDKTYQGIQTEAKKWPAMKQKIFHWSLEMGHKSLPYKSRSEKLPLGLGLRIALADKLVLSKLRGIFGGKIKAMPCSGAAINTEILRFFHAVGIFVNYGYGATETTATVSCFKTDEYHFGSCGTVMPGVEVEIAENGEILVKGKSVFQGYYKKEEATANVLKEGWFYTGDEGYMDNAGNLIMLDRIKDLMKTSVGKYVSPQKLELLLGQDEAVEQIVVVGDNRQYVTALIVPVFAKLVELARKHDISFSDEKELVNSEKIKALLQERFNNLQASLMSYEKVVKFTLLSEPFTIEAGTMTTTLKLRRRSIERNYRQMIDAMYDDI